MTLKDPAQLNLLLIHSSMPIRNRSIKRLKGPSRVWSFINQLESSPGRFNALEEIQVVDLEIDDEDILDWFLRHAFSHPQHPNLVRAVLYMDGVEVRSSCFIVAIL